MSAGAEADDLLAAELAFRLLDPQEEAGLRSRAATDVQFASRIATWERLASTLLMGSEELPPPSLWGAIDARLPGNDDTLDGYALAARWRAASVTLGVLAAVLGVLALNPTAQRSSAPTGTERVSAAPLVAVLHGSGAAGTVAVTFDPSSNRLTLATQALDAPAGSIELWAIAGNAAPRSLGLIPVRAPRSRTLHDAAQLIAPGVTLAVTLEPIGGSPTGSPSTAPLLTGTVAVAAPTGA